MGEAKRREDAEGARQKRRVPEAELEALRLLQAAAEEAASLARTSQAEAQIALEAFQRGLRAAVKRQGAPVTHGVDLETGEIGAPPR